MVGHVHVHLKCLGRWQLTSAGRREESTCRFCSTILPDWKPALTPHNVKPVSPVMAIKFEGRTYKLKVRPGQAGLEDFQQQVQKLLGFEITSEFEVMFECKAPQTGETMKLNGLASYSAATHCAAITAAQRLPASSQHQQETQPPHLTTPGASKTLAEPGTCSAGGLAESSLVSNTHRQGTTLLRKSPACQPCPTSTALPQQQSRLDSRQPSDQPQPQQLQPQSQSQQHLHAVEPRNRTPSHTQLGHPTPLSAACPSVSSLYPAASSLLEQASAAAVTDASKRHRDSTASRRPSNGSACPVPERHGQGVMSKLSVLLTHGVLHCFSATHAREPRTSAPALSGGA
ncbi:MAG: hypothetical protein WDW36_000663 [Sanguina aurantia]